MNRKERGYDDEIKEYFLENSQLSNNKISKNLISKGVNLSLRHLRRKIATLRNESNIEEVLEEFDLSDIDTVTVNESTVTTVKDGEPVVRTTKSTRVKALPIKHFEKFNFEKHLNSYKSKPYNPNITYSNNTALINIYDAHIDKLSFTNNNTITDNINKFIESFTSLLKSVSHYNPELIIFPIGSDFFNSNGLTNTTKKGTPQHNSVSPHIAFDTGLSAIRHCIDLVKDKYNIHIPVIAGNHDEDTCFYLGKCINFIYENDKRVSIDSSYTKRKYFSFHDTLLGFGHGAIEKKMINNLPLIMAEEQKELWAKTKFRHWYLGDIHHKQEYQFLRSTDFIGVEVNFLRAISEIDNWHHDQGYIGIPKSSEASVFSKGKGEVAKFKVNL